MNLDPLHDPRIQALDQERKLREEKGIYRAPNFTLWLAGVGLFITLIIIVILIAIALHIPPF